KDGRDPGVWFFSLDASNSLAVWAARRFYSLPYWRADMELIRDADRIAYRSRRRRGGPPPLHLGVEVAAAARPPPPPGSLLFFLVERYFLYALRHDGTLVRGQVHHAPYPLRDARVVRIEESLIAAAGIAEVGSRSAPVVFSDGVDVDIFRLMPVGRGS